MKELLVTMIFEYDEIIMHAGDDDEEARDWFLNEILLKERLLLLSNEIGGTIGECKILSIKEIKG